MKYYTLIEKRALKQRRREVVFDTVGWALLFVFVLGYLYLLTN